MSSFVFGVDIFVFVFGANESTHSSFTCGRKAKTDKKSVRFPTETYTYGWGLRLQRVKSVHRNKQSYMIGNSIGLQPASKNFHF